MVSLVAEALTIGAAKCKPKINRSPIASRNGPLVYSIFPGATMRLTLETQVMNDVVVIRCKGRIVLGAEAADLQAELDTRTELWKKVVLNLAEADYLDSFGLGTLVRTHSVLRARGGELKLCELHPSVLKVLQMTNLLTVFATYQSEKDAIEAFSGGRRSDRTPVAPSTAKILCVDTSPDLLAYVSMLLKRAGYEVFTSRYVGEAVTLVNVIKPSVMICGAGLAELTTGAAAIEKFRQSGLGMQILHLPTDFSATDAGHAGVDLLNRLQSLLTA
jgi:anti-anti-sigma factor